MQPKLLRVLQERQIERLGSSKPLKVDVRIVAATNRDLEKRVAEGRFRQDLYYRLNVFPIRIPPLRERPDEFPPLVWSFVDEFSSAFAKPIESVSKESMLALQRYPWPGNVRELRNVVERAVIVAVRTALDDQSSGPCPRWSGPGPSTWRSSTSSAITSSRSSTACNGGCVVAVGPQNCSA